MASPSEATILISHYNCPRLLGRAIESIDGQTYRHWRLIVVDDASDSINALTPLRERFGEPRVIWLRTNRNVGQFRIYNRVLPYITSRFFMLQDADDWSTPTRLETLLAEAERTGTDILGSWVDQVDTATRPVGCRRPPQDVNRALRCWRRGGIVIGPTLLCRTEFVRRLGGFDGTTRIGGDTDLVCRAVFRGRVRNFQGVLYLQTQRPGSLTSSTQTGFTSELRRRYARALDRRHRRHLVQRWIGIGPTCEDLRSRPNDVDFALTGF
jgi:glycosyltransferase involved in cell wall biosynthesis